MKPFIFFSVFPNDKEIKKNVISVDCDFPVTSSVEISEYKNQAFTMEPFCANLTIRFYLKPLFNVCSSLFWFGSVRFGLIWIDIGFFYHSLCCFLDLNYDRFQTMSHLVVVRHTSAIATVKWKRKRTRGRKRTKASLKNLTETMKRTIWFKQNEREKTRAHEVNVSLSF